MTKTTRQKMTKLARIARKLAMNPAAQRSKARTRQITLSSATPDTLQLCQLLADFSPIPEMAIDKFNIDIAIPELKVAIELDGGNWHAGGRTRARDIIKERLLQKSDWIILRYVDPGDIDKIRSALNRISPTPI